MYYFYILQSLKDQRLYFGFTEDLRRRFREHQNGESAATKARRPFRLVYYEAYSSKKDALNRERQIKLRARAFGQLKQRIQGSLQKT